MAESTLSLAFENFQKEVSYQLGWGLRVPPEADRLAIIELVMQAGYRQFLSPPRLPGQRKAHRWRFLHPVVTLTTSAPYATGTVTVVNGDATVTLSAAGTWPSWAASGELEVAGSRYDVLSHETGSQDIELTSNYTGSSASELTYALRQNQYELDDDTAGIDGPLTYKVDAQMPEVVLTGEAAIRQRQQGTPSSGRPFLAAVRHKASDGTDGQRLEVMFYPTPDAAYILAYRKRLLLSALTETAKYPYGGMVHAETLLASCLAVAERRINDERGLRWEEFMERLSASIDEDNALVPDFLRYNDDTSDLGGRRIAAARHVLHGGLLWD